MESEIYIYRGGWIYSPTLKYLFEASFFQILIYSIILIGCILTYWEQTVVLCEIKDLSTSI